MTRILVTGSREWSDHELLRTTLSNAVHHGWTHLGWDSHIVVIHGGANGADSLADQWARQQGFDVEVHHADWQRHGKRAGILRNREMVGTGADFCVAFPLADSRGTRDCYEKAIRAGIPTLVIPGKRIESGDVPGTEEK